MEFQNIDQVSTVCEQQFGEIPKLLVSAPGRVNLIGEHTDYNDGFVLPIAIDKKVVIGGSLRNDKRVRLYSLNFEERSEFSIDSLENQNSWTDYVKGVIDELFKAGYELKGFDAVVAGNVPRGAGLSSSAALEVSTAFFLAQLHDIEMSPETMAQLCQRAENQFIGMNCGIMDQFISRLGQKEHALYLDCRDLSYQQIPCVLGEYTVVICNSNVKHKLVDSAYNERRAQCEEGVRLLQSRLKDITALRDVSHEQLEEHASLLSPTVYQRCKHIITENERVIHAVEALKQGNLEQFGVLLNQSHTSLRDDYEVSCEEVDHLVDISQHINGTLGARITGGGFGGSTVNIVKESASEDFQLTLLEEYKKRTGIHAEIYTSNAENGVQIETL